MALGGYFCAMATYNALVTLPDTDKAYAGFADLSRPGFGWIPKHVVQPIGAPFTVVLIGWEIGIGSLVTSKGRLVRIGLLAALLQVVGLAPFLSWYELANVPPAVLALLLLHRDYDRSLLEMIRRAGR